MANFVYKRLCARHAADRTAATLRQRLRRGATSLRAIYRTAPLLGMFGTTMLLINETRAASLPFYGMCDRAGGVAETLVPFALSLPVAIFASAASHCLSHQ